MRRRRAASNDRQGCYKCGAYWPAAICDGNDREEAARHYRGF
jgi:hypothetical protein